MIGKRDTLVEHNDLITAHYDMSALEQNIFSLILAQLQKDDPPERRYRVLISDIEALTKKNIDYIKVRSSTKKLLSRICTIVRENGDPLYVSMISDAEHVRGKGYVEIGISSKLRPYLFDLKINFTTYQLRIFGALRSKYSKRIYKMLSQFKHTGIMRVSVEELKKRLKLIDPKTGKEKFKIWTTFVEKVIKVAVQEINEHSDLCCTYEAKKVGRKFSSIEFKIALASRDQLKIKYAEDPGIAELHKRLIKEFRLSDWQATDIIMHVPEVEIRKTFYEIKLQIANDRIQNIGGYSAKIFDRKYQLGFFGDKITLEEESNERVSNNPTTPSNTEQLAKSIPTEVVYKKPQLAAFSRHSSSYNSSREREPFTLGEIMKKNLGLAS